MHQENQSIGFQEREAAKMPESKRILRLPQVKAITGLSRSTLYSRVAAKSFPKQISLGGRAAGWLESEVFQIVDAYAAGYTLEQLRALVLEIESTRKGRQGLQQ